MDIPLATFGWPDHPRAGRLWTARYQNPGIIRSGLVPVRITLGAPRFVLPYQLKASLPDLAPPASTFKKPYLAPDPFRVVYRGKLDRVGFETISRDLGAIRDREGADPVLLCFEDVVDGRDWCHRLIFAEWWFDQTSERILELQPPVV